MSAREVELTPNRLPLGWWLSLIPLAAMIAVTLYVATQWDRIPERFPVHWDSHGVANGWRDKTLLGVFGPSILFTTVWMWLWAFGLAVWYGTSRASQARRIIVNTIAIAAWPGAILHPLVALLPLTGEPPFWAVVPAILVFFALIAAAPIYALREFGIPGAFQFKLGGSFYTNRNDPAVFTDKPGGGGLNLNFANPWSWLFFAWPFALPLAIRWLILL